MLAWLLLIAPHVALADPPHLPEEAEELDIDEVSADQADPKWGFQSDATTIDTDDDDAVMTDFVAAALRQPPEPVHFHYELAGVRPRTDAFPIQFVAHSDTIVVVEIPVLVATSRASFHAAHPRGIRIEAEWAVGAHRVALQQTWTPDMALTAAPTLAFLKAALPMRGAEGQVQVRVRISGLTDPDAEPVAQFRRHRTVAH